MPIQRKGLKYLKDIKTHAGSGNQTFYPHKAFMRISCLEMEKARRSKEKESALKRVAIIDNRLKEIKAEQDTLLNLTKSADKDIGMGAKADAKSDDFMDKKETNKKKKWLVLRY